MPQWRAPTAVWGGDRLEAAHRLSSIEKATSRWLFGGGGARRAGPGRAGLDKPQPKFLAAKSQLTSLSRKVSTNFGRRLR